MIFILQSWISKVVQSDETQADAPIIASYNEFLDLIPSGRFSISKRLLNA